MLLHPNKNKTKRLRDILYQLYGHLDGSTQQGGVAHDVGVLSILFSAIF
jgi:V-type H+-transporting ATPase subunit C